MADICPFCGEACGHWAAAVAEIKIQTDAADAAAEAVGAMATKVSALIAESNRLQAIVEKDDLYSMLDVLEDSQQVKAERDRLRADYESLWSVMKRVGRELDRILGDGDLGPDARATLLETVSLNVNLVLGVGAEDDE